MTAPDAEQNWREVAAIFEYLDEAIIIADSERRIVAVNPAYTAITGYEAGEVIGRNPRLHQAGRHDKAFYAAMWDTLARTGHWQGEIWNRRKNGEIYPAWENINTIRDESGRIVRYIAVMADISPVKQAEERLNRLAHHDALTGLSNRLAFAAHLERVLERARRHRGKVALLLLDLDRFKLVNDTFGHAAGDRLLQIVAERLQGAVRAEDMVARLGGDEFAVLLEDLAQAEDAAALAQKLIDAVAEPMLIEGREIVGSTSIGIGIFPDDAASPEELTRAADTAMYGAKNRGRHTYAFYARDVTDRALERQALASELRRALAAEELRLVYQPIVEIASGRPTGVAALLRWQHPVRGLLLPEQFVRIAQEARLDEAIDTWVVHRACAQLRAWPRPLRVAVKLSHRQLLNGHLVTTVGEALAQHATDAGGATLELELPASALHTEERIAARIAELRALGVGIAIEDCGFTGPALLGRLNCDALKLDRALLHGLPGDEGSRAVLGAVIATGRALGLRVCANGVEHREQLALLRELGCQEAQGGLIGEPVDAGAAIESITRST